MLVTEIPKQVVENTFLSHMLLYSKPVEAEKVQQVKDASGQAPIQYQEVKNPNGLGMLYVSKMRMPDGSVRGYAQTENTELYNGININSFERKLENGKPYINEKGEIEIVLGFPGNDMSIQDSQMGLSAAAGSDLSKDYQSVRKALPGIFERLEQRAHEYGAKGINITIIGNSIGVINTVVAQDWLQDYIRHRNSADPAKMRLDGVYNIESFGAGQALQDVALRRATLNRAEHEKKHIDYDQADQSESEKSLKDSVMKNLTSGEIKAAAETIVGENTYTIRDNYTIFHAQGRDDTYDNAGIGINFEILSTDGMMDSFTDHKISVGPTETSIHGAAALNFRPDRDMPAGDIALGGEDLTTIQYSWALAKSFAFSALTGSTVGVFKSLFGDDRSLKDLFNTKSTYERHDNPQFNFSAFSNLPPITPPGRESLVEDIQNPAPARTTLIVPNPR